MNETFVMDSMSHTVETRCYRTRAVATGCRYSTSAASFTPVCRPDPVECGIRSLPHNSRGFTGSAIANRAL